MRRSTGPFTSARIAFPRRRPNCVKSPTATHNWRALESASLARSTAHSRECRSRIPANGVVAEHTSTVGTPFALSNGGGREAVDRDRPRRLLLGGSEDPPLQRPPTTNVVRRSGGSSDPPDKESVTVTQVSQRWRAVCSVSALALLPSLALSQSSTHSKHSHPNPNP